MSTVDTELRALDAEIAVKLFGWEWLERIAEGGIRRRAIFAPEGSGWIRWNFDPSRWFVANESTELFADWDRTSSLDDRTNHGLPHYSTDIAAAMSVVEKMRERYTNVNIHGANGWGVSFGQITVVESDLGMGTSETWTPVTNAETLPLAICRAALKTVNG